MKLVKIFTNSFFCLLFATLFLSAASAADTVDKGYILGEKDTVNVQVYVGGDQQIATDLTVDSDGRITVPILGSLQAKGLTPAQLEQSIRSPLAQDYFVNPQVILKVTGFHSLSFFISGAVNNPGKYDMEEEPTLMELIGKAGGLKNEYGYVAYITHKQDNTVTKIDLIALLNSGSASKNIRLKNGDTVQIPFKTEMNQEKTNVFIEGEVKNPGMFPYRPGLTVLNACIMAGGFTERAALERATIVRKNGQQKKAIKINLEQVKSGAVPDPVLQPGDFVNIPEGAPGETNVYIEGEVKNPGMFPYRPGLTALNVCIMAGGFNEFAAPNRTKVIRKDGQEKKVIEINLEKVKAGDIHDLALQPGDFINVPQTWL
jgi:polysaccharide export outer membrane protein